MPRVAIEPSPESEYKTTDMRTTTLEVDIYGAPFLLEAIFLQNTVKFRPKINTIPLLGTVGTRSKFSFSPDHFDIGTKSGRNIGRLLYVQTLKWFLYPIRDDFTFFVTECTCILARH